MPTAVIDGIPTRYEVTGSGPPLLMFSPGGFDSSLEGWRTVGVYRRLRLLDHLGEAYTCVTFDRRESGGSGDGWSGSPGPTTSARAPASSTTSGSNGPT
ncbi:alpha/beta fold hydrolase [Streptomyces chiangmaiensis]